MNWDSFLEPPEPIICCSECEDDPEHDVQECLDEQDEAAAEAKAEAAWEDRYLDGAESWAA